jgi:O-methyltransferase involved in polyketide biosynthesis
MLVGTKYFDERSDQARREGARQIVILGAGFDSRRYRFEDRLHGIGFFGRTRYAMLPWILPKTIF